MQHRVTLQHHCTLVISQKMVAELLYLSSRLCYTKNNYSYTINYVAKLCDTYYCLSKPLTQLANGVRGCKVYTLLVKHKLKQIIASNSAAEKAKLKVTHWQHSNRLQ